MNENNKLEWPRKKAMYFSVPKFLGLLLIYIMLPIKLWSQESNNLNVKGRILDEFQEPVTGATIIVDGTTNGTISDLDGGFTLNAPEGATLKISYIGYKDQSIKASSEFQTITLEPSVLQLDEVVAVAYGSKKRRDVIGSVSTVKGENLVNAGGGNFENALQGMAPGLQVISNGITGEAPQIKIRGISSISSNTDPLWIIDGIAGSANNVNVNDIESIQVLKDASATAMYGSRGSNGVIIVTTKRGKGSKPSININYNHGFTDIINTDLGYASTAETFEIFDIARKNYGLEAFDPQVDVISPYWSAYDKGLTREEALSNNADMIPYVTRLGQYDDINVSMGKGDETANTYFSVNYRNERTAFEGLDYDKLSARFNTDMSMGNFTFGMQSSVFYRHQNDISQWANKDILPWIDLYDSESKTGYWNAQGVNSTKIINPLGYLDPEYNNNESKLFNFRGNLFLNYKSYYVKGLSLRAEASYNYSMVQRNSWLSKEINPSFATHGTTGNRMKNSQAGQQYQVYLTYDRTFNDHAINLLVGNEIGMSYGDDLLLSGSNIIGLFQEMATIGSIDSASKGIISSENKRYGIFTRAEYKYKERYLVGGSFVREGSSRFTPENRYGNFYSASAGWIISEEGFMQSSRDWLSLLKIRGSFGETGNQNIPESATRSLYNSNDVNGYYGETYMYQWSIGNKSAQWEKTQSIDAGIDFGILNNRINGSFAYYRQNVSDMLLSVPLPASAGIPNDKFTGIKNSIWANAGNMYNQGIELDISFAAINNKNFSWTTSVNLTTNKNKVTGLNPALDSKGSGILSTNPGTITKKGYAIGTYYMPEWAGVDPETGVGTIYEIDQDIFAETGETVKTGKIIPATNDNCNDNRIILEDKTPLPTMYGTWSNNFSFKGVDLSFSFYGSYGNYIYNRDSYFAVSGGTDLVKSDWLTQSWQKPGDIAKYPQLRWKDTYNVASDWSEGSKVQYNIASVGNTMNLEDASFLRLRNLTLGYTIPSRIMKKAHISKLRIYASANNLFTLTKFTGYDPEIKFRNSQAYQGVLFNSSSLPQTRSYVIGVNLNF